MKLLALDTSSDACSVALQLGDDVFDQHVVQAREHTRILIGMIRKLMDEAVLDVQDLDAIVLGNGPGSFIGMRIAASVAQGLAFGAGLKIIPISSLAVVAAETIEKHGASDVIVAQDARMNEVYLGRYRDDGDGLPEAVADEMLHAIATINGLPQRSALAAGHAWQKNPQLLELNRDAISDVADITYPKARFLLDLGKKALQQGRAVDPENLVPAYIRMKVAQKPEKV